VCRLPIVEKEDGGSPPKSKRGRGSRRRKKRKGTSLRTRRRRPSSSTNLVENTSEKGRGEGETWVDRVLRIGSATPSRSQFLVPRSKKKERGGGGILKLLQITEKKKRGNKVTLRLTDRSSFQYKKGNIACRHTLI